MKGRFLSLVVLVALLLAGFAIPHDAYACNPVYHVVKPGQYLAQIAASYGVTVQSIVQANNLWNPNVIYVGQVLAIPVSCAPTPPPSGCFGTHVVKAGEYLKVIAARYRTTVTALVNLNGIRNPNLIYPGQRLRVPIRCPAPKPGPTPKPPSPSTGPWTCEYFNNRNLVGTPVFSKKVNLVDFNFGTSGPGGGIGGTNFSIRCTRTRTLENGQYLFYARSDDGVRVFVDNVLVMDHFVDQPPTEFTVGRQLGAGDHKLRVEYYQHAGSALVRFFLQRYDGINAWRGEYFNNMNLSGAPAFTRFDPAIDFNFVNAPAPGVSLAHFSVRWTGEFFFTGGSYRFTATTDDGMRVFLDDNLILDQFRNQPPTTYRVDRDVSQGTHKLRVEYFQNTGSAVARLTWAQR